MFYNNARLYLQRFRRHVRPKAVKIAVSISQCRLTSVLPPGNPANIRTSIIFLKLGSMTNIFAADTIHLFYTFCSRVQRSSKVVDFRTNHLKARMRLRISILLVGFGPIMAPFLRYEHLGLLVEDRRSFLTLSLSLSLSLS